MINIFCDGGARGNPGPAAYGFVVKVNETIAHKGQGFIGIATNNFAEYTAIIKALSWAKDYYHGQNLLVYLDSQLATFQLSGLYKVKNAQIRQLVVKVRGLETNFGQVSYQHVPREQNKEADKLVNLVLDKHGA